MWPARARRRSFIALHAYPPRSVLSCWPGDHKPTVTACPAVSGRKGGRILPVSTNGAQRASRRRSVLVALGIALVVLVGASPVSAVAASGPWLEFEKWALHLTNCSRTGGWIRSDGSCAGYGSGRYSAYVPPLTRHVGISDVVSRPWARTLSYANGCYHGDLNARLRTHGYLGWAYGENLACWNSSRTMTRAMVLWAARSFQAEASYNGSHWANIKNRNYRAAGVGIWRYNGRIRLVMDFYRCSC